MKSLFLVAALLTACSAGPGALPNGTWTVALSKSKYTSGTLTLNAPQARLVLVLSTQGQDEGPNCVLETAQVEVDVAVSGGMGTGSSNYVWRKSGAGCSDTDMHRSLISTFQIKRTAGTGTGFENPDGSWEVTGTRPNDVATLTFTGGLLTGAYMNRANYSFSGSVTNANLQASDTRGATLTTTKN